MTQNIFISYRRSDSGLEAQFLRRELSAKFGEERIFFDKGINPGANFVTALTKAVGSCDILLALIGPRWLNEENKSRLHLDEDWVRVEISTALNRKIQLIPVLIRGASIPTSADLPPELEDLPYMQAVALKDDNIEYGLNRLFRSIEQYLENRRKPDGRNEEESIPDLVRRARLAKAEADQMYLETIKQAKPHDVGPNGSASVDLGDMMTGFDQSAHHAKLQSAYRWLKKAEAKDRINVEVLLLLAELLIELTPDDPTDEQELLYKVQSLIPHPRNETESYQLAKATFLLAVSGEHVNEASLRDARAIFEKLGRKDWVRQIDDVLRPPPPPNTFHPVGQWVVRDSSYAPSLWQLQLQPNGTFQGMQQTPAMGIHGPVQGQWGFDPANNALHIQGVLNGMVPFGTSIFIQGQNTEGWYGIGNDGVAYALQRA